MIGDVLAVALGGQALGDGRRHRNAEVGLDQYVLKLLERVGVELALGEDGDDAAADRLRRARHAAGETLEPGRAFGGSGYHRLDR